MNIDNIDIHIVSRWYYVLERVWSFCLCEYVDRCVIPENAGAELSRWRPAVPAQPVSFPLSVCSTIDLSSSSSACIRLLRLSTMAMFSLRSSLLRRASSSCSWASCKVQVLQMNRLQNNVRLKSELKIHHTLRCPWRPLSCFWASDACLLAWLSWISISLRSPSIFFFSLRASFLLRVSDSSELCRVSIILCWFLLVCSISSSFSVSLRSISALIWLNSSWALSILLLHVQENPMKRKKYVI